MIKVEELQFKSFDDFELAWRWTNPEHAQFSNETISEIKILSPTSAELIHAKSMRVMGNYCLDAKQFAYVQRINTSGSLENIQCWLNDLPPRSEELVFTSWSEKICTLTSFEIVKTNWDNFFYPSSDDAIVLPLSEQWVLYYFHEEEFQFGQRRA